MKTSEFIRGAIDTYLSPRIANLNTEEQTAFICICLERHRRTTGFPSSKVDEIDRLVYADLKLLRVSNSTFYSAAMSLQWQEFLDNNEFQQLRFMYAEFLALEFEDMGD